MKARKSAAKYFVLALCIFTLAVGFSYAQRLTGTIRGTVTDEEGMPLPGVTLELSSPVLLGGVHSQLTGKKGGYRFANLPPGTYTLVLSLEGFRRVERIGLEVVVNGTVSEDIILKQVTLEESITVIGEAPIIDVTSSGMSSNYGKDLLEKLPVGRSSYLAYVIRAPGVISSSGYGSSANVSAFGSNTESNAFMLDGLDATSAAAGFALLTPHQDIFAEVEVSGIGQPAEYGNFSGIVVNTVTKSGGNTFSGSLSYYGQFQSLTDDNNPDPDEYYSYTRHQYFDAAFTLGGPIVKDKVWFFGSANFLKTDSTSWNVDPQWHSARTDNNYMLKISAMIGQKHKLVGVFTYNYYDQPGVATQWRTPSASRGYHNEIPIWNFMYTGFINNDTFLELKSSGYSYRREGLGGDGVPGLAETVHYDLITGLSWGGTTYPYWVDYSRLQVNAHLSHFAEDFIAGDHNFKVGVQYNRGKDVWAGSYSGGKFYYDYGGEPYLLYEWPPFHYGNQTDSFGAFFDDSWSLTNRLTLNLGLRYDHQNGSIPPMAVMNNSWEDTSEIHPGIKNMVQWRLFSPRIGLAYTLTSDNKTVLKAHYGRYYDNIFGATYENAGPLSSDWTAYWWDGEKWEMYMHVPGEYYWTEVRDLEAPVSDSFVISLERELFPDFSIGLMGTYREWRKETGMHNITGTYELVPIVSPDNGETYMVYNQLNVGENKYKVGNLEDGKHSYKGISLILNKRYSNNWLLNGSLTWSRSYGLNAISSTTVSTQMNVTNWYVYNQGKDPNNWINARGLMNMDRTWVLKLQFGFNFPWDIFLSLNYSAMTGRPYVRRVRVRPDQGFQRILAEPRSNKQRHDNTTMLDFRVEKTLTLYRNVRFSVHADVFNLFNNDTFASFRSYNLYSNRYGEPSGLLTPRRIQIGVKLTF